MTPSIAELAAARQDALVQHAQQRVLPGALAVLAAADALTAGLAPAGGAADG